MLLPSKMMPVLVIAEQLEQQGTHFLNMIENNCLCLLYCHMIFYYRRNRNGTCFTSSECAIKGGIPDGLCAGGYGVCCTFILNK